MPPLPNPLSPESIRQALRAWDSTKTLGTHPLADFELVEAQRQTAGYSAAPGVRGLALREVLREAIDALKPDDSEPDLGDKRWRPYFILQEQYLDGRKPAWVTAPTARLAAHVLQRAGTRPQSRG